MKQSGIVLLKTGAMMNKAGKPKSAAKAGAKLNLEQSFATWLGVGTVEIISAGKSGRQPAVSEPLPATATSQTAVAVGDKAVAPPPAAPARSLPAITRVGTPELSQAILSKQRRSETVFITAASLESPGDAVPNRLRAATKSAETGTADSALPERFAEALGVFAGSSPTGSPLTVTAAVPLPAKTATEHRRFPQRSLPATVANATTDPVKGEKLQPVASQALQTEGASPAAKVKKGITTSIDPAKGRIADVPVPVAGTPEKMPQQHPQPSGRIIPAAAQGAVAGPQSTSGTAAVVLGDDETRFEQQDIVSDGRLHPEGKQVFADTGGTVPVTDAAAPVVTTGEEFTRRRSLFRLLPQSQLAQQAMPVVLPDSDAGKVEPDATIWLEAEQHDETVLLNILDPLRAGSGPAVVPAQTRLSGTRPDGVQNSPLPRLSGLEAEAARPEPGRKIVPAEARSNQQHQAAAEHEQAAPGNRAAAPAVAATEEPFRQSVAQANTGPGDTALSRAVPVNALAGINLNPQGAPIPGMLQPAVRHVVYLFRYIGQHLETQSHFRVDAGKLGMLEIRVIEEAEGRRITILTDGEDSRNLLQKSLPLIRQTLSESNIPFAQVSVDIGNTAGRSQEQLAKERQNRQSGTSGGSGESEAAEPVSAEATRYYGYNNWEITV